MFYPPWRFAGHCWNTVLTVQNRNNVDIHLPSQPGHWRMVDCRDLADLFIWQKMYIQNLLKKYSHVNNKIWKLTLGVISYSLLGSSVLGPYCVQFTFCNRTLICQIQVIRRKNKFNWHWEKVKQTYQPRSICNYVLSLEVVAC